MQTYTVGYAGFGVTLHAIVKGKSICAGHSYNATPDHIQRATITCPRCQYKLLDNPNYTRK